MQRPNFQQIEEAKNDFKYIGLYRLEDMMEKLKLLNYETNLLKSLKMKPLSRYYFLNSINPGEQFYLFTSLCAFLARKIGRDFEQPQEFDDPTVLIGKIIKLLQDLDISTDFSTNKLMQGAGFVCYYILNALVNHAIKINLSHLGRPEIKEDDDPQPEMIENTNEIILENFDDEQYFLSDDDANEHDGDDLFLNGKNLRDLSADNNKKKTVKSSLLTGDLWKLEVERALPQLKIVVKPDMKEWRTRWEQMKQCLEQIDSGFAGTEPQLKKIQNDLTFSMDKIESREKHLNNDLKTLIDQYKAISMEHGQITAHLKQTNSETNEFEKLYDNFNHEYEAIKMQMEQRGATMSDGSPFINLKKTITRMKEEIIQMDLEISVMQYSIDKDIIKENALFAMIKS